MSAGMFFLIFVLGLVAVLATVCVIHRLDLVFHSYSCLCAGCQKLYIKDQWERLESSRKDAEWMEWRRTVDKHFEEIKRKSSGSTKSFS
jgi:hypothetical protein